MVAGLSRSKYALFKFLHEHEREIEARVVGIETVRQSSDGIFVRYAQDYVKLNDAMRGVTVQETTHSEVEAR